CGDVDRSVWRESARSSGGGVGVSFFKSEMLNVECSMLNVEWLPSGFPFNIEHSTLNIQHSRSGI
ncbi:MAG: hypothetical protein ACRD3J_09170, partial [Thermoanaerobaculia bacterium]